MSEELLSHSEQVSRLAPDVALLAALSPDERAQPDTTIANDISVPLKRREARILLVEDNPVNLAVAQKILIMLGYQPDSAVHGKAALQSMQHIHYDLVFMDCQMPVLDGYAATRCWRDQENPQGPRLPIVAMTAKAMTGDRERCLEAGMDEYLSKPISHKEIEACLHRWLSPAPITLRTLTPGTEVLSSSAIKGVSPIVEPKSATASVMQTVTAPDKDHTTTDLSVLDHELLAELKKIAGKDMDHIIYLFLKDAPKLITQLQESATRHETNLLSQAAHTLKSSSANVGALAVSDAAQRIESAAHSGDTKLADTMVALLVTEYERVRPALNLKIAHLFGAE
ncbi:response regulator [Xylella taiwanensis]|nr:response regulator [Xylella taiwanensis]MCD8457271.1 response regulator [Xylella taiwanensis]MCD8459681.1 response regulator [Xylella taiwanensis]MCD8462521.1 response regulator [Xylella taiwanensis]MCD8469288.1 response regulator [Xylella taiwanensis]UFM94321.1 response regulator [Xylella taiwanensis]